MTCTKCDLCKTAQHPALPGKGITNSEVMIIGDYVHQAEDMVGEVFTGIGGRTLLQELSNVGIDPSKCYVTKAVKCSTPGDRAPKQSEIKACLPLLKAEIDRIKPKYILVIGGNALKATLGKTSITDHRGKEYEWEGARCVATYAPGAVLRQPKMVSTWRADLNYFARMLDGEWKEPDDFKWQTIITPNDVAEFITDLNTEARGEKLIAYDVETTCLHDMDTGKLLMLGIATARKCWIINFKFPSCPVSPISKADLSTVLSSPSLKRVAHNGKFDNRWLRSRGILAYLNFDTYLASYCLNVTLPHDLKYLSKVLCGAGEYAIDARDPLGYPFEEVAKYCALDCYYTRKLYPILKKQLIEDQGIARVFTQIVMPGARVLEKLEERGAYINRDKLIKVREEFVKKAAELDAELTALVGGKTVNWNSTQQLAEILFNELKLPRVNGDSTAKGVLLRLADKHPIPGKVLELRKTTKSINAFLDPWLQIIDHEVTYGRQPRIHTTYNIAKTATGRLSSEAPNLQQVPRLKDIRNLVSAPPGRKVVEVDGSQIELRVTAFIAGAETMKSIYRKNGDIHTETGCEVSGVSPVQLTKEQRTAAKAVNFGFVFGMWWKAFKDYAFDSYGVIYTDVQAIHARERFFQKYYELLPWHERQKREVRTYKGVRTPIGRFRHLPNIDSPDRALRGEAERQAINTPVQSMASDMTIIAMIEIEKRLDQKRGFIFGQVHDAILVECDEDYAEEVARICKECMEDVVIAILKKVFGIRWDLPMAADVKIGGAWGAGTEWNPNAAVAEAAPALDFSVIPMEF